MTSAAVKPGSAADAVDGVVPRQIVEPADANELASTLQAASPRQTEHCAPRRRHEAGMGPSSRSDRSRRQHSKAQHAARPSPRRSDRDRAGRRVARELNRELARHGQWLPIDSAFDAATIGGVVATNDSRPAAPSLRHAARPADRRHARAHRRASRQGGRSCREERRRVRPREAGQRIVRDASPRSSTRRSSCCRSRRHQRRSMRRMTMGKCWRGMWCRWPRRSSSRWRSTSCSMAGTIACVCCSPRVPKP